MGLQRVVTDDEADLELLSLANDKGKFALQLGLTPTPHLQFAFERGIDAEWFTLVDIGPIAAAPGIYRVFRLTARGWGRLRHLQIVLGVPAKAGNG